MCKRLATLVALVAVLCATAATSASASRSMLVGIFDDAQLLYGNPDVAFPDVKALKAQVVRVTLYWGGPLGAAPRRPADATDPTDRAYRWGIYDRAVQYAN